MVNEEAKITTGLVMMFNMLRFCLMLHAILAKVNIPNTVSINCLSPIYQCPKGLIIPMPLEQSVMVSPGLLTDLRGHIPYDFPRVWMKSVRSQKYSVFKSFAPDFIVLELINKTYSVYHKKYLKSTIWTHAAKSVSQCVFTD